MQTTQNKRKGKLISHHLSSKKIVLSVIGSDSVIASNRAVRPTPDKKSECNDRFIGGEANNSRREDGFIFLSIIKGTSATLAPVRGLKPLVWPNKCN